MLHQNQHLTEPSKHRFSWRQLLLIFLAIPLLASSFAFLNTTDAFAAITDAKCDELIKNLGSKTKDTCTVKSGVSKKACEDYGGKYKDGSIVGGTCTIPIDNKGEDVKGGPNENPDNYECKDKKQEVRYNPVSKEWSCAVKVDLAKNKCKSTKDKDYFWGETRTGGVCYEVKGTPERVGGGDESGKGDDSEDEESDCQVKGIGFVVCPLVRFVSEMTDTMFHLLEDFLRVQPVNMDIGSDSNATFKVWSTFLAFANIAFVIVLLIIIFSYTTSIGVDNYNIKKILPRLVVAVVLVNGSYIIAALAVDISNIIGSSIKELLDNVIASTVTTETGGYFNGGKHNLFSDIATVVLSAGAIGAGIFAAGVAIPGAAGGMIAILFPMLAGGLIAVLSIVVVLLLRQAIVTVLIVVSPLAFVAYLLPNTSEWFTKWRKLLTTMLLLYPIVALIFGASKLAGVLIMNANSGDDGSFLMQMAGAFITVIPLFVVPTVMKGAGGMLNSAYNMVNGHKLANAARSGAQKAGGAMSGNLNNRMNAAARRGKGIYNTRRGPFKRVRTGLGRANTGLSQFGHNIKRADQDRAAAAENALESGYLTSDAYRGRTITDSKGNVRFDSDGNIMREQGISAGLRDTEAQLAVNKAAAETEYKATGNVDLQLQIKNAELADQAQDSRIQAIFNEATSGKGEESVLAEGVSAETARAIRDNKITSRLESMRGASAEQVEQDEFANEMIKKDNKNDAEWSSYAGGIDVDEESERSPGALRAVAQATEAMKASERKNIESIKQTAGALSAGQLGDKLKESIRTGDTVALQAYQDMLATKGEKGIELTHEAAQHMEDEYAKGKINEKTYANVRTEFARNLDGGMMSKNEVLKNFANGTELDTKSGELTAAPSLKSVEEKVYKSGTIKWSVEKFASQTDSVKEKILANPGSIPVSVLAQAKTPQNAGHFKEHIHKAIDNYISDANEQQNQPND